MNEDIRSVAIQQQTPTHPPVSELHAHFRKDAIILDIEELKKIEGFENLSRQDLEDQQLQCFSMVVSNLAEQISRNTLELGWLIDQGNRQGFYLRVPGYKNMYDWLVRGLHIGESVYKAATNKFNAWLLVKDYNVDLDLFERAQPLHIECIQQFSKNVHTQVRNIVESQCGKRIEDLPQDERKVLFKAANEAYKVQAATEIHRILSLDTSDLKPEIATNGGTMNKPVMLHEGITYNPVTGELRSSGYHLFIEDPTQVYALQKGQVIHGYRLAGQTDGYLTIQQLGAIIADQFLE